MIDIVKEPITLPLRNPEYELDNVFVRHLHYAMNIIGLTDVAEEKSEHSKIRMAHMLMEIINDFLDIVALRENRKVFKDIDIIERHIDFLIEKKEELEKKGDKDILLV